MWITATSTDIVNAASSGGNAWTVLAVLITTAGTIFGLVWVGRRGRERPTRSTTRVARPAAAQTAREAVEEAKQIWDENILQPLEHELSDQRRKRQTAEDALARAERLADARLVEAERLSVTNDRIARELADERRMRQTAERHLRDRPGETQ